MFYSGSRNGYRFQKKTLESSSISMIQYDWINKENKLSKGLYIKATPTFASTYLRLNSKFQFF